MHLLLGYPNDLCCAGVFARLHARGLEVRVVSEPLAPPACLTWRLEDGTVTSSLCPDVPDTEIAGVLVRDVAPLDPEGWDPNDYAYMQAEVHAVILAWLAGLSCAVINRADAARWYGGESPLFAWRKLLHRSGLRLPEVVVTSDPDEAKMFRRCLARDGVEGAVYVPQTGTADYLLADDEAWKGLAGLQMRTPVCLTEPHGPVTLACIVGDEVIFDGRAPDEAAGLELSLVSFAMAARLAFVEIAMAPVRCGLAVMQVETHPQLEHFSESARSQILDALVALLDPTDVVTRARMSA